MKLSFERFQASKPSPEARAIQKCQDKMASLQERLAQLNSARPPVKNDDKQRAKIHLEMNKCSHKLARLGLVSQPTTGPNDRTQDTDYILWGTTSSSASTPTGQPAMGNRSVALLASTSVPSLPLRPNALAGPSSRPGLQFKNEAHRQAYMKLDPSFGMPDLSASVPSASTPSSPRTPAGKPLFTVADFAPNPTSRFSVTSSDYDAESAESSSSCKAQYACSEEDSASHVTEAKRPSVQSLVCPPAPRPGSVARFQDVLGLRFPEPPMRPAPSLPAFTRDSTASNGTFGGHGPARVSRGTDNSHCSVYAVRDDQSERPLSPSYSESPMSALSVRSSSNDSDTSSLASLEFVVQRAIRSDLDVSTPRLVRLNRQR